MGISEHYTGELEPVYTAALSLGIANQLTNVLRDVGEDIDERDRIYLPTDELERFDISEKEVRHWNLTCSFPTKVQPQCLHLQCHLHLLVLELFKGSQTFSH